MIKIIRMIQIQKKSEQFNRTIFDGKFVSNKPVASGFANVVSPYSNIFYWSHAVALDDCEFGLHPHQGFEIMTFVLEGTIAHFDTTSEIWTPLRPPRSNIEICQSTLHGVMSSTPGLDVRDLGILPGDLFAPN